MDLLQPDKLIHVFLFSVFFFLQSRGFALQDFFPFLKKHPVIFAFLFGLTLGAFTEIIQKYFIPMRSGSIYDFIANALGCLIGWGAFCRWRKRDLMESH